MMNKQINLKLIAFNMKADQLGDKQKISQLTARAATFDPTDMEQVKELVEELRTIGMPMVRFSLRKYLQEGALLVWLAELTAPKTELEPIRARMVEILLPLADENTSIVEQGGLIFCPRAKALKLLSLIGTDEELARIGSREKVTKQAEELERKAMGFTEIGSPILNSFSRFIEEKEDLKQGSERPLTEEEKSDPTYLCLSLIDTKTKSWKKQAALRAMVRYQYLEVQKPNFIRYINYVCGIKEFARNRVNYEIAIPAAEALALLGETASALQFLRECFWLNEYMRADVASALASIGDMQLDIFQYPQMLAGNMVAILIGIAEKLGMVEKGANQYSSLFTPLDMVERGGKND